MVEGARLESVYAPKAYLGFESLTLRKAKTSRHRQVIFYFKHGKPCLHERRLLKIKKSAQHRLDFALTLPPTGSIN